MSDDTACAWDLHRGARLNLEIGESHDGPRELEKLPVGKILDRLDFEMQTGTQLA
jgi:hypothetical protein